MHKKLKNNIDNDVWVKDHFEEIVGKYAGKHIVVCQGEIFTGDEAIKKARKKYPHIIPLSMPVPAPEDFVSILLCKKP